MSSENQRQAVDMETAHDKSPSSSEARPDSLRRQALNFSLLGGLAAFIAACGKTVSRYDKRKASDGEAGGIIRDKLSTEDPKKPASSDPSSPPPGEQPTVDPNVPGPGLKPGSCLPVSVQIVDVSVSDKTGITVDNAAVAAYQIYNGRTSKLLAIKLAKDKIPLGGYVHLIGKAAEADTSGKILATRRVLSTDLDNGQAGLIFETLVLMGSSFIDVILVNGDKKTKQTIDVRPEKYRSKVGGLDVVDLAYAITGNQPHGDLFKAFAFGGSAAPTMAGTSTPSSIDLGFQFGLVDGETAKYKAASNNQKWNVSALVPGQELVENLFGETQTIDKTSSDLFIKSYSFAVYQERTVGTKKYMVRYFFFVG